jgi:hypothetical protein
MPKLGGSAVASILTALFAGFPVLFTNGYSQDSENLAPATAEWCGKSLTTQKMERERVESNAPGALAKEGGRADPKVWRKAAFFPLQRPVFYR